jgi:hypothetical protein
LTGEEASEATAEVGALRAVHKRAFNVTALADRSNAVLRTSVEEDQEAIAFAADLVVVLYVVAVDIDEVPAGFLPFQDADAAAEVDGDFIAATEDLGGLTAILGGIYTGDFFGGEPLFVPFNVEDEGDP